MYVQCIHAFVFSKYSCMQYILYATEDEKKLFLKKKRKKNIVHYIKKIQV